MFIHNYEALLKHGYVSWSILFWLGRHKIRKLF